MIVGVNIVVNGIIPIRSGDFFCFAVQSSSYTVTAVFLAGNLITTAEEFSYGIHRKNYNMGNREILLNFEQFSDEELETTLEYHKPGCREALQILKDHQWNIFREP